MHVLDANEIFGMTFYTADRIIESGNSDALVLYYRYLKQSRIQDTNKTLSLDKFMWKGLGRGDKRFYKAKKVLKELGLIDIIKTIGPDGKFEDNFVRVNYLIDENRIRNAGSTYEVIQSGRNAQSGNQPEKMLININKNNNTSPSSDSNESSSGEGTTDSLNSRPEAEVISVKDFSDITEIFKDEPEYVTFYKIQIKILLKMVEIGYVVSKDKDSVLNLFKRMKEKAEIFNIKAPDGSISWSLFLQRTDKRVEWNKGLNQTPKNHKLGLMQFLQSK